MTILNIHLSRDHLQELERVAKEECAGVPQKKFQRHVKNVNDCRQSSSKNYIQLTLLVVTNNSNPGSFFFYLSFLGKGIWEILLKLLNFCWIGFIRLISLRGAARREPMFHRTTRLRHQRHMPSRRRHSVHMWLRHGFQWGRPHMLRWVRFIYKTSKTSFLLIQFGAFSCCGFLKQLKSFFLFAFALK